MRLFSRYCQLGVFLLITSPFAIAETDVVSVQEAATMRVKNQAVIIDVRENSDWNEHHIHGAIRIPLSQLSERLPELEPYKTRPIITQCVAGLRSAQAQLALKAAGFSKVFLLNGGIQAWHQQGFVTE
ncbi:rhodanese-like domain-containing protein [Candidatus Methylobacter oryzae]|uniref:Rhodanese-like domain-containing protein n=1 Tax=Candidatus Methylobacter oryzae TaxID=2497749 RepID=A0ABY3C7S4_9GAMM|nr:rhodanese-like domain-containing protein [Candidatus Methylobacter oryzae]TRW92117.1 rhodanese-like domain-containing protein [Candidatus Methylobacter oryzae]